MYLAISRYLPAPTCSVCPGYPPLSDKLQMPFAWDDRDQIDQSEAYYQHPVRLQNEELIRENLELKELLRNHDISLPGPVSAKSRSARSSTKRASTRKTRSMGSTSYDSGLQGASEKMPHLPMEVQLRILKYALTSATPIIDPLSKARSENMTVAERIGRANQIAINFLTTCKAFHTEGSRVLWSNNTFVFTDHRALRNFASLDLEYRKGIKHINLRIVCQFFDDQVRPHFMPRDYHTDLKKAVPIKVHLRPKETKLDRGGFRAYAWTQVTDFLDALQETWYPLCDKSKPIPRLLPDLESMRIDLVNFPDGKLPVPDMAFHHMAAHKSGCTLNELMVTGLPCCEEGVKAGDDMAGMLKHGGLFMDARPAFIQTKTLLKPLHGGNFLSKLPRSGLMVLPGEEKAPDGHPEDDETVHAHETGHARMPAAPYVPGHPESEYERPTVWKLVPVTRDSAERKWVEYDRQFGRTVDMCKYMLGIDMDEDDDEAFTMDYDFDDMDWDFFMCLKCGEDHPPWEPAW